LNFSRYSILNFFALISVTGVGFVISILVGRILGPTGEGQLKLLIYTAMILAQFGTLGLLNANVFFFGRNPENLPAIAGNLIVHAVVMSCILAGIYFLLPAGIFANISSEMRFSAVFLVPLMLVYNLVISLYQAKKLFVEFNIFFAVRPLCCLIFILALVAAGKFTVMNTIFVFIASFVLVDLLQIGLSRRLGASGLKFDPRLLGRSIVFGIKGHVGTMMQYLNYRLDFFIISYILGDIRQVGLYSIATVIAEVLSSVPKAVSIVLFPSVSSLGSEEEIRNLTEVSCRITLFLMIAAGAVFMLGSNLVPVIYSSNFAGSVKPLMILIPGIVMLGIANILGSNLTGRGYPLFATYSSGAGVVVTIALLFILVPRYGITGAAAASTCSYSVSALTYICLYRSKTQFSFSRLFIVKRRDIAYLHTTWKAVKGGGFLP